MIDELGSLLPAQRPSASWPWSALMVVTSPAVGILGVLLLRRLLRVTDGAQPSRVAV